jgi:hypothetical protein
VIDLIAAAIDAGTAPAAACKVVAEALRPPWRPGTAREPSAARSQAGLADDLERLAHGGAPTAHALLAVHDVLCRARHTGLAPAALLRRLAEDQRREQHASSNEATNRLPVLLVLPAGLCLLPAALLLGVAPVVLDLLSEILG